MPQTSLRWTSKPMAEIFMNTYKILPNKTRDINFKFPMELIPEENLGGFIRGFIDGDGSFEVKTETASIFTPRIVGTSKNWLLQIGDIVSKYTGLTKYLEKPKIGKTCTYYNLRWSAGGINKFEKVKKLYNFLYKNAKIFLKRKKDKIEQYLKYRANCESKEFTAV